MNNYRVEPSRSSPSVEFDANSGILSISGESYPENVFDFYCPLLAWTQNFINDTSMPVRIFWHYDSANERALETGEEFAEDLKIPFELVKQKTR